MKGEIMGNYLYDLCKNLIGLNCCYLRVGYGSNLKIGLGKKLFYKNPKLKGKFHGEWDILSRMTTWRIIKNGKFLCGFDDEIELCNIVLSDLECGKVTKIVQGSYSDISISFSNDIDIDFFSNSLGDPKLIVIGGNRVSYELTLNGWEYESSDKNFKTLTDIEAILSVHSEDCSRRWEKNIPQNESVNKCTNCFYFRQIGGYFHFWDYGICSNKESTFDGKVVAFNSGCKHLKNLKDLLSD